MLHCSNRGRNPPTLATGRCPPGSRKTRVWVVAWSCSDRCLLALGLEKRGVSRALAWLPGIGRVAWQISAIRRIIRTYTDGEMACNS